jgi:hypothetical protein
MNKHIVLKHPVFLVFCRGLIKGHAQNEDVFIGEAMTSKMFMDQETGIGLDLAAQIIQQEPSQRYRVFLFKVNLIKIQKINRTEAELKIKIGIFTKFCPVI